MFNSQKRNEDPHPWEWVGNKYGEYSGRCAVEVPENYRHAYHSVYAPRPEYDNNPNPILVEFRMALDFGISEASVRAMFSQLNLHLNEWRRMGANEAQIDHARKVLTRLVNIYGSEEHEQPGAKTTCPRVGSQ